MDRRTLWPLVLGALAIVALAAAAGTLPSATESGGGGGGGDGPTGRPAVPVPDFDELPGPSPLQMAVLLVAAVAVVVLVALIVARHPVETVKAVAIVGGIFVLIALLLWLAPLEPAPTESPSPTTPAEGTPGGGDGQGAPSSTPLLGVVVLALGVLAAVALVVRSKRAGEDPTTAEEDVSPDAAAVGRAAGAAADRIESTADVDNEVYRAWREMTRLLDVPRPEASTAGEFATAAVEAGMRRRDVDELTRLFEDVRYGPEEPTPAMERRAVAVLRRVEETYAGEP